MLVQPPNSAESRGLAIVHNATAFDTTCARCRQPLTVAVGPSIIDRALATAVCADCAYQESADLVAQFYAARRGYLDHLDTDEGRSLRRILGMFPLGQWVAESQSSERWSSDDLIEKHRYGDFAAPDFDLEQPVLFIGQTLYPAVGRLQADVAPLLTLVHNERDLPTLEDHLANSTDLWLAFDGVCWSADLLRHRLTLEQRATWADGVIPSAFAHTDGSYVVIATEEQGTVPLFMLVKDMNQARDAYLDLQWHEIEASGVIAARAGGDSEGARRLHDDIAKRIVRLATDGDIPFVPLSHVSQEWRNQLHVEEYSEDWWNQLHAGVKGHLER